VVEKDYEHVWKKDEDLESLNLRIHDGVPIEKLSERADDYCKNMFDLLYPSAEPVEGARVLEFGGGVGWIMESMLKKFPIKEIIGLDISKNIISRAQERWKDNRAKFVEYDGLKIPFPDGHFNTIYSVATIQHIEKHVAFILFRELYRVLASKGHAILHFLSVHHLPNSAVPYEQECWNHIKNNISEHRHYYYSYEELFVLFSELIGVVELDIHYHEQSYWIHFTKGIGLKPKKKEINKIIEEIKNPKDDNPLGTLLSVFHTRPDLQDIFPNLTK